MPYTAEQLAMVCHYATMGLQLVHNDPMPSSPWETSTWDSRDTTIAGVRAALAGATSEELHQAWCDRLTAAGWVHGPRKDYYDRTHPNLVPYHDLPAAQQDKDIVTRVIVQALGGRP